MSLDIDTLHDAYIGEYYQSLNCPRALTCFLLWSHKEHLQLAQLEFDPINYESFECARDSLAATKFLSKADFLETGLVTEEVALEKFYEAEAVCKETNRRIRRSRFETPETCGVLMSMSYKISCILGSFDANEFVDSCNWGPGSSVLLRRAEATHPKKFAVERQITAEAYDFVSSWFHSAYPSWDMTMEIIRGNKVVTVPKNAKTDRTIAIEPGLNLWFQKGLGAVLRKRLKHNGIDLNDQGINQNRARLAAKFNNLATVDFSMASDTVSKELVREVLPERWYTLLNAFRSMFGFVGSAEVNYEKFSSMGNGFTFELESLVFYTMALAVCDVLGLETTGVSVYGDDVILPSEAFDLFSAVSKDLGFTVNSSKSYDKGNFRESCGEYYWRGYSIKPIYHKVAFDGQQSVVKACNQVRIMSAIRNDFGCDRRLKRVHDMLVKYLGEKFPRVPMGIGDLGIIGNSDESFEAPRRCKHGHEGFTIQVIAVQAEVYTDFSKGLLLQKVGDLGKRRVRVESERIPRKRSQKDLHFEFISSCSFDAASGGNHIPLPGRIRYARCSIRIQQWADLGPWC